MVTIMANINTDPRITYLISLNLPSGTAAELLPTINAHAPAPISSHQVGRLLARMGWQVWGRRKGAAVWARPAA